MFSEGCIVIDVHFIKMGGISWGLEMAPDIFSGDDVGWMGWAGNLSFENSTCQCVVFLTRKSWYKDLKGEWNVFFLGRGGGVFDFSSPDFKALKRMLVINLNSLIFLCLVILSGGYHIANAVKIPTNTPDTKKMMRFPCKVTCMAETNPSKNAAKFRG